MTFHRTYQSTIKQIQFIIKKQLIFVMEQLERKINRKTLKDFKSTLRSYKVFNDAKGQIPTFLQENLLDEARCVKIFVNDDYAMMKIFYFQFLKLCFEAEDVDYDTKINKFIVAIQKNTNLLRISQKYTSQQILGQTVKDIMFQFLEILSECKQPVQSTLARYPVIGSILSCFLAEYLNNFYKIPLSSCNTASSIRTLSNQFEVDIVQYDSCIQFTDSQVYLYKENEQKIYMVYIDETKVCRNTIAESAQSQEKSSHSLKQNGEIIQFGVPDIIFEVDQSCINVDLSNLDNKKMGKTNLVSTAYESNTQNTEISTTNLKKSGELGKLNQLFETNQGKQQQYIYDFNITKQFTDTFLLDTLVAEPHRTRIKDIKAKARNQRKSRQPFFI